MEFVLDSGSALFPTSPSLPVIWPPQPEFDRIITGTENDDTLAGTAGRDRIDGLAGNDLLQGEQGDDLAIGGAGNDTLEGGADNDILYGDLSTSFFPSFPPATIEPAITDDSIAIVLPFPPVEPGNNVLNGGAGNDTLNGGAGNDTLIGGEGDDVLNGGSVSFGFCLSVYDPYGFAEGCPTNSGDDELEGGAGRDLLNGANGSDELHGGTEDDTLNGGRGDDALAGGEGDDLLRGGIGSDTLAGGAGGDRFYFSIRFPTNLFIATSSLFPTPEPGDSLTLPPLPEPGIDTLEDFSATEGDRIEVSANGPLTLEQFSFDRSTGVLAFEGRQFAQLQSGGDFDLSRDLILVTSSFAPIPTIGVPVVA